MRTRTRPAGIRSRVMSPEASTPVRLRTSLFLALLAALAVLHGCEDVQVTAVEVASVTVSPSQVTLLPGETAQLAATPRDASGSPLEDRPVSWSSDDTSLATVNSSGMVEGLTPGQTVIRASAGSVENTATVTVGAPPRIALSRTQVALHGVAGGDVSQPEDVAITNDGAGTLSGLTATVTYPSGEPQGWLDASLGGSQAPATLTLQASPAQLAEGTYRAQVEVASEAAGNSPRVVEVELEVDAAPARIALSTSSVGFVWEEGQSPPSPRQVGLTNEGGGSLSELALSVAYVEGGATGWLSPELDATTAPTQISLEVQPGSLETGVYDAIVEVSSPAAANSPQELRVRLTVGDPPPEIELIPDAVEWSTTEGESPSGQTVQVQNKGSGELGDLAASVSYAGGEPTGWLSAQLQGTTAPTSLQLSVQASDLPPGTYSATVEVSSPDAVNSPRTVAATLQVDPGIDPEQSEIDVNPGSLPADGEAASTVTIRLMDANQNSIGGLADEDFDVALTDGEGGGTNASHSTVTETATAGTYTFEVTNTTAEEVTVIVTARGTTLDDRPTIQFVAGDAETTLTLVSGDGQAGTVGEELDDPLVVQVTDEQGNPVSGVTVTWDPGADGSADPTSSTTGTNGQASTTWTLGSDPGEQTLTATADGVDESVTFTATASGETGEISPSQSNVDAEPNSGVVADGEDASTVTVELRSPDGNSVGGLPPGHFEVSLTADGSESTTAEHTAVRETSTTGTYTFEVTNTAPEDVTVTVTARGTTLNDQPTIQFVAGSVASLSIVSGNEQTGTAGEALDGSLVVEVADLLGNPVPGVPVSWTPDDGDGSADPATSITGTNGQASTTWTLGDEVGEQTLTASADGVTNPVTFTADARAGGVSASTSNVNADPETDVAADGSTASEVTVELRDSEDNPIGGVGSEDFSVTLTDDDGGSTDASHSTVTETATAGTYTFDVTNTTAEEVTVVVTARGTIIDAQPTIEFVAADVEMTLTLVSGDGQEGTVGEALDSLLVVEVTDGQGSPVSGVTVTWDPDDGSADPSSSTTGTNGQASTTWTLGDEVGEQTLTASAEGVDDPVTFTADAQTATISASASSVTADPETVAADGEAASTVEVGLRNAEDDPVAGIPPGHFKMTLTVNGTESTTAKRTPVKESSTAGTYTFDVTNSAAEEVTVIVTVRDITLNQRPTIRFVGGGGQ